MSRNIVFRLLVIIILPFNNSKSQVNVDTSRMATDETQNDELSKNLTYGLSIGIGARFSFIDKDVSSDLYYDISAFYPDGFYVGKAKKRSLGIDFGFHEASLFNTPDRVKENRDLNYFVFNEPSLYKKVGQDSIMLVFRSYNRHSKALKLNGLSLYFSPTYEISKKLFFILHFQHDYQISTRSFEDVLVQADSLVISKEHYEEMQAEELDNDFTISSFGTDRVESYIFESTFVGIGGIFFFNIDDIKFRVKPSIGYAFYSSELRGNDGFRYNDFNNLGVFIIDFRFIESKKYNIKIGGEIHGSIGTRSSYVATPSIYLSKIFDLGKIMEFVTK